MRFRSIGWIWIYNCCLILVFLIYGFERVHLDKNIGLIVGSNNGAHFDQYQTDKTIKKFAANSIQFFFFLKKKACQQSSGLLDKDMISPDP